MKRVLLLLPILFMLVSACNKPKIEDLSTVCPSGPTLMGDWELSSYWNSPGGGHVSWSPATKKTIISFRTDSTFGWTKNDQNRYFTYGSATGTNVALFKQGSSDTFYFAMQLNIDTLTLFNLGCIEGCGEKYVRPKTSTVQQ